MLMPCELEVIETASHRGYITEKEAKHLIRESFNLSSATFEEWLHSLSPAAKSWLLQFLPLLNQQPLTLAESEEIGEILKYLPLTDHALEHTLSILKTTEDTP